MKTYKVDLNDVVEGDVLFDSDGDEFKVLGRAGRMVWMYSFGEVEADGVDISYTINELIEKGYKFYGEKESWGDNTKYWFVETDGMIEEGKWISDSIDIGRRDYGGIFRTKQEAQARADLIREYVKGL